MSWTAPVGVPPMISTLFVGMLLTGCGTALQPHSTPAPAPPSCNCVVPIPVRPLDPVPPIVVHPLTKLAARHATAPPQNRPAAPAPPRKHHHRRHPGH